MYPDNKSAVRKMSDMKAYEGYFKHRKVGINALEVRAFYCV